MCSSTAILVRNRGLGTARFAELAAGAGVRAYGVPSHAGGLPTNTGERWGGEKWTNAGIRPIRGWANRRLGAYSSPQNGVLLAFCHNHGYVRPPLQAHLCSKIQGLGVGTAK